MPAVIGPYLPNFPKPKSRQDLGIHDLIYSLVAGGPDGPNTWPFIPNGLAWMIDGRDAAKAVRAVLFTTLVNLYLHTRHPTAYSGVGFSTDILQQTDHSLL